MGPVWWGHVETRSSYLQKLHFKVRVRVPSVWVLNTPRVPRSLTSQVMRTDDPSNVFTKQVYYSTSNFTTFNHSIRNLSINFFKVIRKFLGYEVLLMYTIMNLFRDTFRLSVNLYDSNKVRFYYFGKSRNRIFLYYSVF